MVRTAKALYDKFISLRGVLSVGESRCFKYRPFEKCEGAFQVFGVKIILERPAGAAGFTPDLVRDWRATAFETGEQISKSEWNSSLRSATI